MPETFYKCIGCADCKMQWRSYCPLCKKKANNWRDEQGRHVPIHQLTKNSREILRRCKRDKVTIEDDRIIIIPQPSPRKKRVSKKQRRPRTKNPFPIQEEPITIDNFFVATTGDFREIMQVPKNFTSFFKSKGSEYFASPCGEFLVRESDHWGHGIRNCNWFLEGYDRFHCGLWRSRIQYPKKIGMISIKNLKPNKKCGQD